MFTKIIRMDMLNETIELLKNSKGVISRQQISEDTGLGYEWINKLVQGHIEDPGIKRISTLHGYLSNLSQHAA
jgi:hypothetical protein